MTPQRSFALGDVVALLTIAGMLIAAGLWLGSLERRVHDLEAKEIYLHGDVAVPSKGQKE
jgi:hypothetical protein